MWLTLTSSADETGNSNGGRKVEFATAAADTAPMRRQRRRDAAWNPPSSGTDVTAMFGALMAIPLLLPFVARHRYVAFALPCLVLLVAARRCWGAATRRPLDRNAWRVLGVGNAMCAVAAALAAASPLGGGLVKAALYAGSSGSLGLLVAAALLARRWATGVRLERLVDALLFDAVVIAVGVYFVVEPGFTRGHAVLTAVFLLDLVALAIASVAAIEARDRGDRTAGWCLVGACAAASIGDGLVAAASFGGGGSPPVTALMWTLAGG